MEFAVQIPDTDDILESMLAVPMTVGDAVQGVIVLSSLGYGAFDEEDQRLLEVLASHAAIAISNAKLLQAERTAAETSSALLGLSEQLTQLRSVGDILQGAIETVSSLIGEAAVAFHIRDEHTGDFRLARLLTDPTRSDLDTRSVTSRVRRTVGRVRQRRAPRPAAHVTPDARGPRRLEGATGGAGRAHDVGAGRSRDDRRHRRDGDGLFGDRELRLIRGVADLTSLALGNARRMSELERFHELVAGLDAAFWEASIPGMEFTFVAGAVQDLFGGDAGPWPGRDRTWGSHIDARDREDATRALLRAIESGVGEGWSIASRAITAPPMDP